MQHEEAKAAGVMPELGGLRLKVGVMGGAALAAEEDPGRLLALLKEHVALQGAVLADLLQGHGHNHGHQHARGVPEEGEANDGLPRAVR